MTENSTEQPYKIGVITGNFDIIHPGYVKLFKQFNEICQTQIILLHDDPTIDRPEKIKPILSVEDRIEMLEPYFLHPIFLTYNTEDELLTLLKAVRPDVRLLGNDYIHKTYTGKDLGIHVRYIDRDHGWSTTKLKNLIANTINDTDKETDKPFSGKYNEHYEAGIYNCRGCNIPLYSSKNKFDSKSGWPSYDESLPDALEYLQDHSHGMTRTEILCASCRNHLGHLFSDGPKNTTGNRHCINSSALDFIPER